MITFNMKNSTFGMYVMYAQDHIQHNTFTPLSMFKCYSIVINTTMIFIIWYNFFFHWIYQIQKGPKHKYVYDLHDLPYLKELQEHGRTNSNKSIY